MTYKVIVMGVSGCGKSTLGSALAAELDCSFIEGDALHLLSSVAKMAAGVPLTDQDRWPWLDRVGDALLVSERSTVASCSALKRAYRDYLRNRVGPELRFVMADLPREILLERMETRASHFMPSSLLGSQLVTLERPENESDVLIVDGRVPVEQMVKRALTWLA